MAEYENFVVLLILPSERDSGFAVGVVSIVALWRHKETALCRSSSQR